jgi:hypothetical protein
MTTPVRRLPLLLVTAALVLPAPADAGRGAAAMCRLYGFAPATRAEATCRMNARRVWSTGPCRHSAFALTHRRDCHLDRSLDF